LGPCNSQSDCGSSPLHASIWKRCETKWLLASRRCHAGARLIWSYIGIVQPGLHQPPYSRLKTVVAQTDLALYPLGKIHKVDRSATSIVRHDLPADSPGQYQVAGHLGYQSGQRLTTDQGETSEIIGTIEVVTPLARFGNVVALTDVKLPAAKPAAGELLELSLHWMVFATNPLTLNTFAHVIDSQGNLIAQADQQLAPAGDSVQTITLNYPPRWRLGLSNRRRRV
jgi:hypothetical protein